MLVVALMITFGAASALQGVQSDPFEVTHIEKPAPANTKERVASLSLN